MLDALRQALGAQYVLDGSADRRFYSQDVYRAGIEPLAVVQPGSTAEVVAVVQCAVAQRCALFLRGGGMSYTDAFLPDRSQALVVDLRRLNRIRDINAADLHATVEAGCTWANLDAALEPHGLRSIFWGPMSGRLATIGGGMSQGAATFGSGRHGTSAAAALAFEVVLGDGTVLRTGLADAPHRAPFFRNYGPDLTGLFTGDAGALGIKTAVTLQLEPRPAHSGGVSFQFSEFGALRRAVSEVARQGLATEIFGVENALVKLVAGDTDTASKLRTLRDVGRAQNGRLRALSQMARMAIGGKRFLDGAAFSANFLAEARDARRLAMTLDDIRAVADPLGRETANTMAAVVRATPFPPPMVLGPGGRRLLPLHAMLPHSRVDQFHAAFERLRQDEAPALAQHRAMIFIVFAGVGASTLLYEPVIYWEDEWNELHRATMPADLLAQLKPFAANPAGREYVEGLRQRVVALMLAHGAAHLQIGRAYPYLIDRSPAVTALVTNLKRFTDPANLLNPGALGLTP